MTVFTHLGADNQPRMVDVSEKAETTRVARACARVRLPSGILEGLEGNEWRSPKGPVFQTAVVAGVMAAKQTSTLIPLCHPLPLEDCRITIEIVEGEIYIECTAKAQYKTGVEMEALTGAAIAALTIYDMCKALSHDIEIVSLHLLEKTGGKSDFTRDSSETPK
jgi:cyclic pyranopterin phosphate synthase